MASLLSNHDWSTQAGVREGSTEPFLKWAGGKRWALPTLLGLIPDSFERYFEPFLGGGSLFFALRPRQAHLSDANADLINAYRVVRDNPAALNRWLTWLEDRHDDNLYYALRKRSDGSEFWSALRFVYLNRTCWNGLYRVNKKGEFNVPIGSKTAVRFPDGLIDQSCALKGAALKVCDFSKSIQNAGSGDLVYVDPPYTVKHNNNGFIKYNEKIFSWDDQERLAWDVAAAKKRGAFVLVSNAAHDSIRSLYRDVGTIIDVERSSVLAASSRHRRRESEVIIKCY